MEFTDRALKFCGKVRSQVGYNLGGGLVSVSSSSCVMKTGTVGLLSGGMMTESRGTVPTLGGGVGVVHGITLAGTDGRGSLGQIVGGWFW